MLTKSIVKILLLSVKTLRNSSLYTYGWTKVNGQPPNFRDDFVFIHYHLRKISFQIIECKIFAPYDFLEMNSPYLFYGYINNVIFFLQLINIIIKNKLRQLYLSLTQFPNIHS